MPPKFELLNEYKEPIENTTPDILTNRTLAETRHLQLGSRHLMPNNDLLEEFKDLMIAAGPAVAKEASKTRERKEGLSEKLEILRTKIGSLPNPSETAAPPPNNLIDSREDLVRITKDISRILQIQLELPAVQTPEIAELLERIIDAELKRDDAQRKAKVAREDWKLKDEELFEEKEKSEKRVQELELEIHTYRQWIMDTAPFGTEIYQGVRDKLTMKEYVNMSSRRSDRISAEARAVLDEE